MRGLYIMTQPNEPTFEQWAADHQIDARNAVTCSSIGDGVLLKRVTELRRYSLEIFRYDNETLSADKSNEFIELLGNVLAGHTPGQGKIFSVEHVHAHGACARSFSADTPARLHAELTASFAKGPCLKFRLTVHQFRAQQGEQ